MMFAYPYVDVANTTLPPRMYYPALTLPLTIITHTISHRLIGSEFQMSPFLPIKHLFLLFLLLHDQHCCVRISPPHHYSPAHQSNLPVTGTCISYRMRLDKSLPVSLSISTDSGLLAHNETCRSRFVTLRYPTPGRQYRKSSAVCFACMWHCIHRPPRVIVLSNSCL